MRAHSTDSSSSTSSSQSQESSCSSRENSNGALSELQAALTNDIYARPLVTKNITNERLQKPATPLSRSSCSVCGETPSKYRCASCYRTACGGACLLQHRERFSCAGSIRSTHVTSVPSTSMLHDDSWLWRDVRFLEDCRSACETVRRQFDRMSWRHSHTALPPPLYALREAAKRRGILCQIMSEGMKKRHENTSRYDRRIDTITWRVEFRFISGYDVSARKATYVEVGTDWGDEKCTVADVMLSSWRAKPHETGSHMAIAKGRSLVDEWLLSCESEEALAEVPSSSDTPLMSIGDGEILSTKELQDRSVIQTFLEQYGCARRYRFFLQAERLGDRRVFFPIAPQKSLNAAIREQFFVSEYPIVYVVPEHLMIYFPLVTYDDRVAIRNSLRKQPREEVDSKDGGDPEGPQKLVPCRNHLAGRCRLGHKCTYKHYDSLAEVPLCRQALRGHCARAHCSFRHEDH